ncbi:MAG: regulatory protein RecX [Lachnospiraceae bacterium]|nr:regulatory protein RecX [Lachnospiraceae bacterium]
MIVTGIEQKGKKKFKVFIDYDFAFEAGADALTLYSLKEGEEIGGDVLETIKKELIYPAAKKKAMDLLLKSDKSEVMLKRKLLESFSEDAALVALDYVKSFNYIDDRRYAREYYISHKRRQSFMQIEYDLRQNGVSKEDIDAAVGEVAEAEAVAGRERVDLLPGSFGKFSGDSYTEEPDPEEYRLSEELEAARAFIRKKGCEDISKLSYEEKGKLMAALRRKGFSTAVIRRL